MQRNASHICVVISKWLIKLQWKLWKSLIIEHPYISHSHFRCRIFFLSLCVGAGWHIPIYHYQCWNPKKLSCLSKSRKYEAQSKNKEGSRKRQSDVQTCGSFYQVVFKASRPLNKSSHHIHSSKSSIIWCGSTGEGKQQLYCVPFLSGLVHSTISVYCTSYFIGPKFVPSLMLPIHHHDNILLLLFLFSQWF